MLYSSQIAFEVRTWVYVTCLLSWYARQLSLVQSRSESQLDSHASLAELVMNKV